MYACLLLVYFYVLLGQTKFSRAPCAFILKEILKPEATFNSFVHL